MDVNTTNPEDVISNKITPINPDDHTYLNADHVMAMINGILNGKYRLKLNGKTYAEIEAITDKESGELFFATDLNQFVGYNGTDLIILG